ncbi:SwmB domain-containing protein, partial [Prochlorococcus sp. AH-716-I19]|nr:SwmB domain-containing protein [Prochlorococcus sp. AH-716-I19]
TVYENNGAADPTFTAADIGTSTYGASSVFVGDLDRDGDLDIVSTSDLDDTIAWYENVRPTGTDTLTSVETLRFDDQDVDITPAGMTISNAGQGTLSSITGSPIVGGTITAGDITGDPDGINSIPNITYQWQVASNNVWTDLTDTGSGNRDYVPLAEHVNKSLRVKVTYTDAGSTRGYIYSDPVNIYIPDTTVPTITNSQISNDGSKLILTFSEDIWLAPPAEPSDLQVTVDGSTNNPVVALTRTTHSELQATLSDRILSGQQVTLDYLNSSQAIYDNQSNFLGNITSQSVTNISNVIGFVNGQAYEGDFHVMENGMKMTGTSHGSGTDQIIYSTIGESTSSGSSTSGSSTWTYKYESVLSLIENKTWSDDPNATVKPLEIVSDSNGSLYILGSVTKSSNSGPMYPMEMGEEFLGNTLTVLTSSGTHTRTIEIADSENGFDSSSSTDKTRQHISVSSSGITLINTTDAAFLIDNQGNITTLISDPIENDYGSQLRSSIFYDGNFYLQNGGNILRYNESGDLQQTIPSGWDNAGANTQGDGIQFDVGQDIIAVAQASAKQGSTNKGYFYVLEKEEDDIDWIKSIPIEVGHQAHGVKIDPNDNSIYVSGEGPSGGDGFVAKFIKNVQGEWEQSWFSSDPDSYEFYKLDITTDSQILVTGRTGSGGYSAAYDKNGNQTAESSDSASIDHSTSSFGTGYIRKYPENNGQWLIGLGDGYSDLEMPDLNQSYTSTGNPTVNIDYGSGSGQVTTPGNSGGSPAGGTGSGGGGTGMYDEPDPIGMDDNFTGGGLGGGYNWWEMDYETEETADINDLVQVRRGEKGDAVYTNNVQNDYDKKTYILKDNDTSNDPILIT